MKQLLINHDEFNSLVGRICRNIAIDSWAPDVVVGVGSSGLIAAVMISNYLNVPMQSLDVEMISKSVGKFSNQDLARQAFGNNDDVRNILLVTDFNNGSAFSWIVEEWAFTGLTSGTNSQLAWTNNFRFAAVVNHAENVPDIEVNYTGMDIDLIETPIEVSFPYSNWWSKYS